MKAISKLILVIPVMAVVFFCRTESFAWDDEGPYYCEVSQTRAGDFGVRKLTASGWIYIVRQLTYEKAVETLEYLRLMNRCQ